MEVLEGSGGYTAGDGHTVFSVFLLVNFSDFKCLLGKQRQTEEVSKAAGRKEGKRREDCRKGRRAR
jgi:hypothetical protein